MPITRRQFELDIDSKTEEWMDKIASFFLEHKNEAFTEEELRKRYGLSITVPLADDWSAFGHALSKLVETKQVEKRIIRGLSYYAWSDLPF